MTRKRHKNSADFMASHKIYAVFHVFGSLKFKVTFHNVFSFKWVLISILMLNGFMEYQNRKKFFSSFLATEHANLGLVKNCVNSIIERYCSFRLNLNFEFKF